MKVIVRLIPECIGTGKSFEGLQDLKGNHYQIPCAPGFIMVPIDIAKQLESDPRVTVEYPGQEVKADVIAEKPLSQSKKVKGEMTVSTFSEEFVYAQNKRWQVDKIKELSGNTNAKIPRLEGGRVKLILKLQKKH